MPVTPLRAPFVSRAPAERAHLDADQYRLLFTSNPVPMWVYDAVTLRFQAVNNAAVESYGYTRDEFLAMSIRDIRPREDVADLEQRTLALPVGYYKSGEWRHRRKDGTVFPVEITSHSVTFDGRAARIVMITDISDRRAAEDALRQSARLAAIGQLMSGVAHELNNPLSAILMFVETMLQEPRSADDREALTMILDQARRSRAIVRDLLASARGGPMHRECVDLRALLERTACALVPQVAELGAGLETMLAPGLPHVWIDPSAIAQVVTNLIVNGAQAAGPEGVVSLRACATARGVRIAVEDSGPGIPPAVLPRLFEPFFTTKPRGQGTGLGLAVSRGIVEAHEGTLTVENLAGRGARFVVSLDRAAREPAAPSPQRESEPTRADEGSARRVLVIDDEASIRLALGRYFTKRAWTVDDAADGGEALARLLAPGAPEYTLIISDLRMPGLSGIELHDRLARERPALLDRLVFSTGDVASAEARSFIERVHAPILQKPFELATLDRVVARFTGAST